MAVSKRLRFEVFRRDNNTCRYCGRSAPDVPLTIDHVIPAALGGTDDPGNLVTACNDCNSGKSATPPDAAMVADVAGDALRWAQAMRIAAEAALEERDNRVLQCDEFLNEWNEYGFDQGKLRKQVPLPTGWDQSITRFVTAGLPMALLVDYIPIAMGANRIPLDRRFNYLCGIARNKLEEIRKAARSMLSEQRASDFEERTTPDLRDRINDVLDTLAIPAWEYDRVSLELVEIATKYAWDVAQSATVTGLAD